MFQPAIIILIYKFVLWQKSTKKLNNNNVGLFQILHIKQTHHILQSEEIQIFTQILLDEKFLFQKFFLFLRVFFINVASFIIVRYGFISLTDSHKVSYLVSGIGRSKVDKNLWRVNRDQELYIYQTHSGTICLTSLAESTPITFAISFM